MDVIVRGVSKHFIVNVRDARWATCEGFGAGTTFEDDEAPFEQIGINLRVLGPGDAVALYHGENVQEDFLVLCGTCTVIIEGEERQLRPWDFVHCPPNTAHAFIGGPCILLAVGARGEGATVYFPVCEAATRLGVGVEEKTENPDQAYDGAAPVVADKPVNWDDLPWVKEGLGRSAN